MTALTFPLNLEKYHVSEKSGFLLEQPLEFLPEYFQSWNHIAKSMPALVVNKELREKVHQMSMLDYTRLIGYRQYRLAHLQLSIIATGYIWQNGDDGAAKVLPRCIAVPWCAISEYLGLKPVVLHASLVLANWKIVDEQGTMKCLYELPGGGEADWFVIVTVHVELSFAAGLKNLMLALYHAQCDSVTELTDCLLKLTLTLADMKKSFATMHDRLSAGTFYNVLRPFLTGWGGKGSPLPEGIIYEGVSDSPVKMTGGSAAQSSTWQSIDAALGVIHKPDIQEFLQNMQCYMPPDHKDFIVTIETNSKIKQTVNKHAGVCGRLTLAYNQCVQAIMDFRSYHIQVVTKYIVVMASKANRNKDYEALANKGTGGSSILPFLKSLRSSTSQCLISSDHTHDY